MDHGTIGIYRTLRAIALCAQDVRGNTPPSSRAAGATLGKGACRPLSNPLLVASGEAIETSRRFIPANGPRRLIAPSDLLLSGASIIETA